MTTEFLCRVEVSEGFSLRRLGARWLARIVALNARYRERVHLSELDDRMLRDIGISRADVDRELRRPLLGDLDAPWRR